jgi:hypothetical protein
MEALMKKIFALAAVTLLLAGPGFPGERASALLQYDKQSTP